MKTILIFALTLASKYLFAQNSVGIGTNTPGATLDVLRGTAIGGTAQFQGTTNISHFNYGTTENTYIRGGKAGSHVLLNDLPGLGNVGIGTGSPGFPLNFANTIGDKISLWGNSGAHYGFGIQGGQLQIHTDQSSSDILFGYGSSVSFTEKFRLKGTGGLMISGSEGQNGQVLRSNGSGQPVSWSNPLNMLYNNMTEYTQTAPITINPLTNANIPGMSGIVLNITTRSKVVFSSSVEIKSNGCFACGGSYARWIIQVNFPNGSAQDGGTSESSIGYDETRSFVTGNKIWTLNPGNYTINTIFSNENLSGPSITSTYGRLDIIIIPEF